MARNRKKRRGRLVMFYRNTLDGFATTWVAQRRFGLACHYWPVESIGPRLLEPTDGYGSVYVAGVSVPGDLQEEWKRDPRDVVILGGGAGESCAQRMWDLLFPCQPVPEIVQNISAACRGNDSGDVRDYLMGLSQFSFSWHVWDAFSTHVDLLIHEGRGIQGTVDVTRPRPYFSDDAAILARLAYERRHPFLCSRPELHKETETPTQPELAGSANWEASDEDNYDNPLLGNYRQSDEAA